jgi:hypothetical protein
MGFIHSLMEGPGLHPRPEKVFNPPEVGQAHRSKEKNKKKIIKA